MVRAPRFGTDGIRGRAGVDITEDVAFALGRAAGEILGVRVAVTGGDTRESTAALDAALGAGLEAAGVEVVPLGTAPTPMVAYLAAMNDAIGLVVSASHNPYHDNGIKIFGRGGTKLSPQLEREVADRLERVLAEVPRAPVSAGAGDPSPDGEAWCASYLAHLGSVLEGRDLAGLRVIVDAAHGAGSALAMQCYRAAGAEVQVINDRPDGRNINATCGATDPSELARAVVGHGADLGLALDGDADRLIAVDEMGQVVNGDQIIALCARDLMARGRLRHDTVVVTVMTNLGFHQAMERSGIAVVQTPVGDRAVLEAMDAGGFSLGGEQSGHVIFSDWASTGDGMLTGLMLADLLVRRRPQPLSVLAAEAMTVLPQVLINVALPGISAGLLTDLGPEVEAAQARLGESGRVLVRPSGTEPLVRVMVEAPTLEQATAEAEHLAAVVRRL